MLTAKFKMGLNQKNGVWWLCEPSEMEGLGFLENILNIIITFICFSQSWYLNCDNVNTTGIHKMSLFIRKEHKLKI